MAPIDKTLKSLTFIVQMAEQINHLRGYAAYCQLRYQGLRSQAFVHLRSFIDYAQRWSIDDRIHLVDWLKTIEYQRGYLGNVQDNLFIVEEMKTIIAGITDPKRQQLYSAKFSASEI